MEVTAKVPPRLAFEVTRAKQPVKLLAVRPEPLMERTGVLEL